MWIMYDYSKKNSNICYATILGCRLLGLLKQSSQNQDAWSDVYKLFPSRSKILVLYYATEHQSLSQLVYNLEALKYRQNQAEHIKNLYHRS